MQDASKEYCLDLILTYEPTESGKKKRELGIDGQCVSSIYLKLNVLIVSALDEEENDWDLACVRARIRMGTISCDYLRHRFQNPSF